VACWKTGPCRQLLAACRQHRHPRQPSVHSSLLVCNQSTHHTNTHLGHQLGHLVAIERIAGVICADVLLLVMGGAARAAKLSGILMLLLLLLFAALRLSRQARPHLHAFRTHARPGHEHMQSSSSSSSSSSICCMHQTRGAPTSAGPIALLSGRQAQQLSEFDPQHRPAGWGEVAGTSEALFSPPSLRRQRTCILDAVG